MVQHLVGGIIPSRMGKTNATQWRWRRIPEQRSRSFMIWRQQSFCHMILVTRSPSSAANVQKVADKFGDHMDFTDLQDNLKTVEHQVNEIQAMKEGLSNEQAKLYNEFVKMVARQITNVTMTCADKYSQDSYGYTSLSYPIPLFADFERLVKLDPASLEYGLIKTQLVKNKNRINDALYIISQFATLYMKTSKR